MRSCCEGFGDIDETLNVEFFEDGFILFQSFFDRSQKSSISGGFVDLCPLKEVLICDVSLEFFVSDEVVGIALRFSRTHLSGCYGRRKDIFRLSFFEEINLGAFADAGGAEEEEEHGRLVAGYWLGDYWEYWDS
ncbi:MAG: hypothetical protein U1C97_02505 [Candidatus Gracilibacteria bacterium]|nr:hypothetical protein [Candidatus Gracilibacteria bacterium]